MAVIRFSSFDAGVIFDIAVAGPLAGAVLAIPALLFGLTVSTVVQVPEKASTFGDSLLIAGLVHLVFGALPPGYDVLLHPVAFAGWVGLFITSLNLMPISQLDGGHVLYALAPRRAATLYRLALLSLVILCFAVNPGFLLLALLLVLFRLQHPPTRNDLLGLDRTRLVVAALVGVRRVAEQPLERPAGLAIAHPMAALEGRKGELTEGRQEGHLGGHADPRAGGHADPRAGGP